MPSFPRGRPCPHSHFALVGWGEKWREVLTPPNGLRNRSSAREGSEILKEDMAHTPQPLVPRSAPPLLPKQLHSAFVFVLRQAGLEL